ncbi:PDZ domain-containing protein [Salinithrix halophila]|uniref:PDZ domain-containing protein n=1 Tax=Salinithrix halophila TaxID=1485204 RepID=A0ABV8JGG3_9BACL
MESVFFPIQTGWTAWQEIWIHPLWIAALLLAAWQYAWKGIREQRCFGRRLHPPTPLFLRTVLVGLGGGVVFSMTASFITAGIRPAEAVWVWGILLLLTCIRLRFACPAYAVGLLALISMGAAEAGLQTGIGGEWTAVLWKFSVVEWLFLVSGLHGLEWALVRLDGEAGSTPVVERDGDNQPVGGYLLQKIWPLPLVLVTPAGWLPLPLVASFARINLSRPPEQQKRRSSSLILLYAFLLAGLAGIAKVWPPMLWVASLFCIAGHEGIYQLGRYRERRRLSFFAAVSGGIRVLAVWPGSPAEDMGICPGDILHRVNGEPVSDLAGLREALTRSPAFCKLELTDENGDPKLAHRPVYEGDPDHLGIVEAPSPGRPDRLSSDLSSASEGKR